jgi:hypothetical protein
MPAPPQLQALSPSQGLSGWFSQTHRLLSQRAHHLISEVLPDLPLKRNHAKQRIQFGGATFRSNDSWRQERISMALVGALRATTVMRKR